MKTSNLALANLIFSAQFADYDLYTITLFNGGVLRWTTADFPIFTGISLGNSSYPPTTYPTTPFVDQRENKTQAHWKLGFDTDTWTVVIMPRPFDPVTGATFPDQIGGQPFLAAAQAGYLDAADFQVDRAYFSTNPAWGSISTSGAIPVGTVTIFAGVIAEVDTTDSVCVITANDYRSLMTYSMPRHYYESQCRHTLFDAGCTLNQANYPINGIAENGSSQQVIAFGAFNLPAGYPSFSQTFVLGKLQMTSGQNAGFWRTIMNQAGNVFTLVNPLPFPVAIGDTFAAYPGCNKLLTTCGTFNNTVNFGGQPFIPFPEIAT